MSILSNKIDFAVIIRADNANVNGDPLNGNRPRVNYDGFGEMSDVCIKRKLRDRMQEFGYPIFVQSDDRRTDQYKSLKERFDGEIQKNVQKDEQLLQKSVCGKWFDVRAFGQLFAFSGEKGDKGVSLGIRGPVTVQSAFSIAPISISSIQITKSVSGEGDGSKKASDTMGMKHRVDHGVYVFFGSMNPQLAKRTGFEDADSEVVKKALISMFENDASSARPEGSMEAVKVVWWKHNCATGQYSSAKVHRSLKVNLKDGISEPKNISDYNIIIEKLEGLVPDIYDA